MTNNAQKSSIKRFKFLIPLFISVFVSFLILNSGGVNKGNIILSMFASAPFLLSAFFHYKYEFNKEWKKVGDERIEREKHLPWYEKTKYYKIFVGAQNLIILLFLVGCFITFFVIKKLFSGEFFDAILLLIFMLTVFIIFLMIQKIIPLNKVFPKGKK